MTDVWNLENGYPLAINIIGFNIRHSPGVFRVAHHHQNRLGASAQGGFIHYQPSFLDFKRGWDRIMKLSFGLHRARAALLAVVFLTVPLWTQAATPPSETFVASSVRTAIPTVLTMTAAGPSTLNSAPIVLTAGSNLTCIYNGVSHTGTPANVVAIQGQIPGTATYFPIISSTSIATDVNFLLSVGTTMVTATNAAAGGVPANSAINQVLPAIIRVQVVLGAGTTPTTTGSVSCFLSS